MRSIWRGFIDPIVWSNKYCHEQNKEKIKSMPSPHPTQKCFLVNFLRSYRMRHYNFTWVNINYVFGLPFSVEWIFVKEIKRVWINYKSTRHICQIVSGLYDCRRRIDLSSNWKHCVQFGNGWCCLCRLFLDAVTLVQNSLNVKWKVSKHLPKYENRLYILTILSLPCSFNLVWSLANFSSALDRRKL